MTAERSTERRDLDWQALIETALTAPGRMGDTYNRFYSYSFMNQLLLLMQGVQEPVATYQRWKDIGRQVLRGSKAKEIVRPITIKKKDDDGEVESSFTRFKLVKCLFTYSETEGEELPPADLPGWDLDTALGKLSIKRAPFTMLNGNIQGFSVGREIAVNPVATDPLGTTFHELGHVVLGHTEPDKAAQYALHRGTYEFQAEATSYLTMHELGVMGEDQAGESRAYIQGWLRTERPSDVAIRQLFGATDQILRAGRADEVASPGISTTD
jgi:antirestriction protein ArdC